MIKPHKYLDLNLSILNLGGIILTILQQEGLVKYDDLLQKIILSRGDSAKEMFLQALSFLFLLGKIEYRKEIDSIEYYNETK